MLCALALWRAGALAPKDVSGGLSFLGLGACAPAPEDVSNKVLPQKILVCCVLSWPGVRTRIRIGAEIRDEKIRDEKIREEKTRKKNSGREFTITGARKIPHSRTRTAGHGNKGSRKADC